MDMRDRCHREDNAQGSGHRPAERLYGVPLEDGVQEMASQTHITETGQSIASYPHLLGREGSHGAS